jgi:hypothetical protein
MISCAHVLVQLEVAGLDGAAAAAVLSGVGEGPGTRDHSELEQLLPHIGGGFTGGDVDRDLARAGA